MTADQINFMDLIIKIIGLVGAGVAFLFGYQQYKKGQNWQKAQILLSLIDSFEDDPRIECACQMLDWDEREVTMCAGKSLQFKNEMLVSALRVPVMDKASNSPQGAEFSEAESVIRDSFDAFFDFLHKLYAFRRNGLLSFEDLTYFYYWFELVRNIGKYKENAVLESLIFNYINKYNFVGAKELLDEYAKKPDPLLLADERFASDRQEVDRDLESRH